MNVGSIAVFLLSIFLIFNARRMDSEASNKVETSSRHARWRIKDFASRLFHCSSTFEIDQVYWYLSADRRGTIEMGLAALDNESISPPTATFNIRVLYYSGEPKTLLHPEMTDKKIETGDPFVWEDIDELASSKKIIIDVEFVRITKTIASNLQKHKCSYDAVKSSVQRMFTDSILTDIDIDTSEGGTLRAHRAILAARSPVFERMFTHEFQEKQRSSVTIFDMSSESCKAFVSYLYGSLSPEDMAIHYSSLLRAADKYDVGELKEECERSLIKGIDTENALERIQMATLFGLDDLKRECIRFLVTLGKICDVKEGLDEFLDSADKEVVSELFKEVIAAWKGFR